MIVSIHGKASSIHRLTGFFQMNNPDRMTLAAATYPMYRRVAANSVALHAVNILSPSKHAKGLVDLHAKAPFIFLT